MALWMVRSWGGVDTERDGDTDPVILIGRRTEAAPTGTVTVELIETRSDQGLDFLRRQPQVVSCEPASAGIFPDDTEGDIEIAPGAGSWQLTESAGDAPGIFMTSEESGMQQVPVKMYRSDGRIMIAAPMPGLEPPDLSVDVTADNRVILRGGLRGIRQEEKDLLLNEWTVGNYERTLELPRPVDGTMANVTYDNGVLVITLPVTEQTRPAHLSVPGVGEAHGQRQGNAGRPPRPAARTAGG